ncbi:MAG: HAD-IIIC family phosphatase [Armatimonadota bacterium]
MTTVPAFDLNNLDTSKLSDVLEAVAHFEAQGTTFDQELAVSILRNYSCESAASFVKLHCYASGLQPAISLGAYDTMHQELLAYQPTAMPDLIVLTLMLQTFDPGYGMPGWRCDETQVRLQNLYEIAESHTTSLLAVNTFLPPLYPATGTRLPPDGADATSQVLALNQWIRQYVREHPARFVLLDWERYARILGAAALDQRSWYAFKMPFRPGFFNLMGADIAAIGRALKGKAKKCLVLDCDNTLWEGVVGEEGLHGIKLDPYEYPGVVYYQFQRTILHLIEQGVMVALCSKNNPEDVWEVFSSHPHCLLKRELLVGWRLNWQDKTTNLRELAEELNIGLEHMIFVDDNPVECAGMRQMLPSVTVVQVPAHLHRLPDLLFAQGWFTTLAISEEDRQRTAYYHAETQRQSAQAAFINRDEFLASLEIALDIRPLATADVARVAQLTQRTNQFNLTTRRYSEEEVHAFLDRNDIAVFTLRVADRFGDYGLTGTLIARREGDGSVIDSLLLSCRILGREIEGRFVNTCLQQLTAWDVSFFYADYLPTAKNAQVRTFWETQGFRKIEETPERIRYQLPAADAAGR